ncbi:uncharacterized protein SCHCODRAFT_02633862 [Schizophyllum commune H4-8]|uniref:uncharacterized protein n=1 Tax=Schizophyllum commune (strain H4-8 / FGSC 9210) TaxID=578458 RepID=UPI00215F22CD|nr:uncharacterized protein SCHCODRAFT_02633862 [Schizophyllum commune H4-8]KAI5889210.1 hypothetical protein SCHCODRAFT_02633862 [Schizophyllum commune H4-8]
MNHVLTVIYAILDALTMSSIMAHASPLATFAAYAPEPVQVPAIPACATRCLLPAISDSACDPSAVSCFCSSDDIPAKIGNCILDRCSDAKDISSALLSLPDCRTADLPQKPAESWLIAGILDLEDMRAHEGQMVMSVPRL